MGWIIIAKDIITFAIGAYLIIAQSLAQMPNASLLGSGVLLMGVTTAAHTAALAITSSSSAEVSQDS